MDTRKAFLVTATGAPGLTKDEIRGPRFTAPSRGVRIRTKEPELLDALTDAALITKPDVSVLCDVSAAQHWGLPLPAWIGLDMENRQVGVAVARGASRQRRRGVRGRRLELPKRHLVVHEGWTVTSPARTWVDCAEHVPIEHLVAMGDVLLRKELATSAELDTVIRWARGRRGVRAARQALPLLDPRSDSPGESQVRCVLLLRRIPKPECNVDIVENGEWLARPDLVWRRERVIAEYDGIVHLPERQRQRDALRRNLLQAAGWTMIIFTAADLKTPDRMADLVRSALKHR